jgi:predicted Ser/Thr protein kinase
MLVKGGTFAAYEVMHRLAVGGMGEVYLCRHRMLDRLDAVKVLRPHLAEDSSFRRRFLREALSAARLRHPNVVTVYTAGESDGRLYLAMEYVAGDDLATLLRREGPLPAERTVALLAPVADALDTAHQAHLVHRDVKPSNLVVTPSGGVTLLDFGISRILDDSSEITRTGEIVGTIAYCSPEQLSRRMPIGGACDQYSLACVAFECLTGEVPFPREGQLAMMTAHLTAPPPRASAVRADLPVAVNAVLARALAKDPAQRYPTCTAFLAALSSAVRHAVIRTDPAFPDQGSLLDAVRSGSMPVRARGDVAFRVGFAAADGGPMVVRLPAVGPLAVRGDPIVAAGLVRWVLAQAVAGHAIRDLCVIAALAPVPGETWLWAGWLPHARPTTPPVSGPHLASVPDDAADLVRRVWAVVQARGVASAPRVLAVVDSRLATLDLSTLTGLPRAGVDLVILLAPGMPTPYGMSTLDLLDGGRCRLAVAGQPAVDGTADSVGTAYVRELADHLPDA